MPRFDWYMPPMFVKNNYFGTSMPYHTHCCGGGGNNILNLLFEMQILKKMMQPRQQYDYQYHPSYPGLDLQQRIDPDLVSCKMLYPEYTFTKVNDEFCCRTSDGTLLTAPTAKELLQEISEYKPVEKKSKIEVTDNDDDDDVDVDDRDDEPITPEPIDLEGWGTVRTDWFKTNFTDKNITKPTVDQIIEKLYTGNALNSIDQSTLSDEQKANLKADLIDANKDLFDNEGRPTADFDAAKLKLPLLDTFKSEYGAKTRVERDYVIYMNVDSRNHIARIINPITGTYRRVRYSEGQEASAAENLRQALLAEGFKDVTIKCPDKNINADKISDNSFDKTAKYHLMFALSPSNNGTGYVYLPNGEEYKLTDLKTRHGDDKNAMKAEMIRNLKNQGWTNLVIQ